MGPLNMASQQYGQQVEPGEKVGEGEKIKPILREIFDLMDDNGDQKIDGREGIAIGMAMGESKDQAKKSWTAMCKDMDDDGNTSIEWDEWFNFYKDSLKEAPLDDVLKMLDEMKSTIAKQKEDQKAAEGK